MWLYRKGFTMLLLKMLKLSEPGFAFTDQHFHFILKDISIFRRQGGFLGDLSWQLNKDLHNISSDIFQILFDFYFLIFFYCQLRHSALPCEGTRGAAHKVSSHCYFGGNNMNIYVENIVFEVKLRIFLLTILNILGWEIVSEVKLGIFFVESNEFSFRK